MRKSDVKRCALRMRALLLESVRRHGNDAALPDGAQRIEDAAYFWFIRLVALRYMQLNGVLPGGARAFPQNAQTLLSLCDQLPILLPGVFEPVSDRMRTILTDDVPRIGALLSDIPARDWTDNVQIVGWMHQYYHSVHKDEAYALRRRNGKIDEERVPAATQLFTPDWVVRYMAENTLGQLWIGRKLDGVPTDSEQNRQAAEKRLADSMGWRYYMPHAAQDADVCASLNAERDAAAFDPAALRVIDPCMGSGHILVYAFDVLMRMYADAGVYTRDAVYSILRHNLYGLDIDDDVRRLADFAVRMKAFAYLRELPRDLPAPHLLCVRDSADMTDERIALAADGTPLHAQLIALREAFRSAREYGSLLRVPALSFEKLFARLDALRAGTDARRDAADALLPLVRQAQILAQSYDAVLTNPPYMGAAGMRAELSAFMRQNYPDSKADLCAAFIERCGEMLRENGYLSMLTQHAWMFLTCFENLRRKVMQNDLVHMAHLGRHAFDELGGEIVQTTAFVLRARHTDGFCGIYCRLTEPKTPQDKELLFLAEKNRFIAGRDDFRGVPGAPLAYWLSPAMRAVFQKGAPLSALAAPKQGIATADNARFLRLWYEVRTEDLFLHCRSHAESAASDAKWYPYNKGGGYRKWYGNNDYVVLWQHDGRALRAFPRAVLRNQTYYFRECISWSLISSHTISFRYKPCGHLFDVAGMSCFALPASDVPLAYLLALNNSCLIESLMSALAPTLNFQVGNIADIPVIFDAEQAQRICALAQENVTLARQDWDAFETSWDFQTHPLI